MSSGSLLPTVLATVGEIDCIKMEALRPFMKNINCRVIVLKKLDEKASKDGHLVYTFRIADDSGSAILSLFDEVGKAVENGDILLIVGGFVTVFQNEIRVSCRLGTVLRQGRFTMQFSDQPDHSSFCWMPSAEDPSKLVKQLPTPKPARRPFKRETLGKSPKVRKSTRKSISPRR